MLAEGDKARFISEINVYLYKMDNGMLIHTLGFIKDIVNQNKSKSVLKAERDMFYKDLNSLTNG